MANSISHGIKRLVRWFICVPVLNSLIRACFKVPWVEALVPRKLARRIPVVGAFDVELPSGRKLYLRTDGKDLIATRLFWDGWHGYEGETLQLFLDLLPCHPIPGNCSCGERGF